MTLTNNNIYLIPNADLFHHHQEFPPALSILPTRSPTLVNAYSNCLYRFVYLEYHINEIIGCMHFLFWPFCSAQSFWEQPYQCVSSFMLLKGIPWYGHTTVLFVLKSTLFPLLALSLHIFSFLFCCCSNSMQHFNNCLYLIHLGNLFGVNVTLLTLHTLNFTVPPSLSLLALSTNFSHPTSNPCFLLSKCGYFIAVSLYLLAPALLSTSFIFYFYVL